MQLSMMLNALLPPSDNNTFLGVEVTESIFITSLIWSVGAAMLEDGRIKFDSLLKRLAGLTSNPAEGIAVGPGEIPTQLSTLYEYFFDSTRSMWVPWTAIVPEYKHDPEVRFNEILVPTVDTVRTTWLVDLMVKINRPVVLVGETGTSKSATIQNFLRGLEQDVYVSGILFHCFKCLSLYVLRQNLCLGLYR